MKGRLLALLLHTLLRRHTGICALLGGLLLLEIGLVLQGLLLVGSHTVRLLRWVTRHALRHSGESTVDSPSTPFESAGSGALRQALQDC